jgi:putative endopeptidase
MKKILLSSSTLLLAVVCLTACQDKKEVRLEDNFYQAVNQKWQKENPLKDNQDAISSFDVLQEEIDQQLQKDLDDFSSGKKDLPFQAMQPAVDFYKLAMNFEEREDLSIAIIKPYLDEIESIESFQDYQLIEKDRLLQKKAMPYNLASGAFSHQRVLYLEAPNLILRTTSNYEDEKSKKEYLEIFCKNSSSLLKKLGYSDKKSQSIIEDTIAFDELLLPYMQHKSGKLIGTGNQNTHLIQLMKSITGDIKDDIAVSEDVYFSNTDKIINEENFPIMKSWLLVQQVLQLSELVDKDTYDRANQVNLELRGLKENDNPEKNALLYTYSLFPEVLSSYYGQTYFMEEDKQQVIEMTTAIRGTFKERLKTLDWLTEPTREKAIEKVDKMTLHIAYPDAMDPIADTFTVDKNSNLVDAYLALKSQRLAYDLGHLGQQEQHLWIAPSFNVNAFYSPTENAIYLPASILQAPFYDSQQSKAENYGGIGTTIAHEMIHAFDNKGAMYDSEGKSNFWWTLEDRKTFLDRMLAVEKQWSNLSYADQKVDGQLTLGENIADAGGLAFALETYGKPDKAFFQAFARAHRSNARKEYTKYLLTYDPHSPDELRTNIPLQNLDAFYEVYDIKEGDGMYLPPQERVNVW